MSLSSPSLRNQLAKCKDSLRSYAQDLELAPMYPTADPIDRLMEPFFMEKRLVLITVAEKLKEDRHVTYGEFPTSI